MGFLERLLQSISTYGGPSVDAQGKTHTDTTDPKYRYNFKAPVQAQPPMPGGEYPSAPMTVLPQMAPAGAKPIQSLNGTVEGGVQPQIHRSQNFHAAPSAPKIPMGDASVGYNPTGSLVGDDGGPLVGHNPQTSLVPPEVPPELLASSPVMQMMSGMPASQGQPVSQMAPQGGHNLFKTLMLRAAHGVGKAF